MKRFLSLAFATLALASSLTLVSATSASAHDEIMSTTPAADSQVAPGQAKVSITFNEPVMDAGDGAGLAIEVTGPDGNVIATPCLSIIDNSLEVALDATAVGDYSVNWRAVSSDGHPNSGNFAFTVAEGAAAPEAPTVGANCTGGMVGATPEAFSATEPDQATMAANERSLTAANPAAESSVAGGTETSQGIDPLIGLAIGIGVFLAISSGGWAVVETQKRSRARSAESAKAGSEE